jgi:hypothetical protein
VIDPTASPPHSRTICLANGRVAVDRIRSSILRRGRRLAIQTNFERE